MPLVAVAAEEAVEMLKAEAGRPQVKRARLTRHPVRHIVHLAEPRCVVAVVFENRADRTRASWHQRVVAGIAGCELRDVSTCDRMVVSSRDQSCSRGRTQRGRVIHVVAKASVCDTLEVGCLDWTAKRA